MRCDKELDNDINMIDMYVMCFVHTW